MEITVSTNKVIIKGNIKTVADYQEIKSTIDSVVSSQSSVTIEIKDSISITSSIIGYLNKLVLKDKIDLNMRVGNAQLMELLEDLSLVSLLKVTKG